MPPAIGYWLLAIGHWPLATGPRHLAITRPRAASARPSLPLDQIRIRQHQVVRDIVPRPVIDAQLQLLHPGDVDIDHLRFLRAADAVLAPHHLAVQQQAGGAIVWSKDSIR